MRECHETHERELLPSLLRGRLDPSAAARVRAHVAVCAACTDEIALLERSARLFDAATPRVNVAAIVAKLPAPAQTPVLTVSRGSLRRPLVPRYVLAAAASLTLVATLSFAASRQQVFGPSGSPRVAPDTAVPAQVEPAAATATSGADTPTAVLDAAPLLGAPELADLGTAELEALLAELDALEVTVAAEPVSMQRAVTDTPEAL